MSDDGPDEGAPSDPRPSGRIRIVGAQPATGEHPTVPAQPPESPAPDAAAQPPEADDGTVDDPNRFGAIPIISADEPPPDPTTPGGVEPEPPAPAPSAPSVASPDLDDLDLPDTAAIPVVPPVEPEPDPTPAPRPARNHSAEDLDDIRVWAAPDDDELDDGLEAGRSAEDSAFADLIGPDDDLDVLAASDDDLPHWSEPATLEGDDDAFTGVSGGPRWRGQGEESGEPEDFSDLVAETTVESPGEDEMIFDDTDAETVDPIEPTAGPPQRRKPYPDAPDDEGPPGGGTGGGVGRDMQQAAIVGAGLVVALLVCGLIGEWALVTLTAAIVVMATAEFFTATRRAGYHPAPLVGLVGSGGLVLGAYWRGDAAVPIVLFLVIVLAMCWWLFDAGPGDHAIANLGITVFGVMWIGGLGSFAALMLRLPNGQGMFYGAVLVAVAADVGGLLVGQRMGRSPLIAASPNKTLEGFIGGILVATVVSFLLLGVIGLFPWEPVDALVLGVVGGIMAPLGDLCESRLKRDLGVKDMGQILPGHGGVLDRFDGMLFVLPATYSVVLLLEVLANTP